MLEKKKLSEAEKARRAQLRKEREAERRTGTRITLGDHGVTRTDLKASRAARKAAKERRKQESQPVDEERETMMDAQHRERQRIAAKESAEFHRKFAQKKKYRREQLLQNTGIEIAKVTVPGDHQHGVRHGWINKIDGYLMEQHHRQPRVWTSSMVEGGNRFAKEYATGHFRGLSSPGYEPRVDNSSGPGDNSFLSIGALLRLKDLRRQIGMENYLILELVCGRGMTLGDLHKHGMGQKGTLGERLRTALEHAAAFYQYIPEVPPSKFLRDANRLIEKLKNEA